jgi:membrane protein implicated in regulation of membrane protease activity
VLPAFLLLAAAGVAKLPRREAAWVAVAVLVVLSAVCVRDWYDRSSRENYRTAAHYVQPGPRRTRAGSG